MTHARPMALPTICMNVMSDVACGTSASLSAYSACAMMTYTNSERDVNPRIARRTEFWRMEPRPTPLRIWKPMSFPSGVVASVVNSSPNPTAATIGPMNMNGQTWPVFWGCCTV